MLRRTYPSTITSLLAATVLTSVAACEAGDSPLEPTASDDVLRASPRAVSGSCGGSGGSCWCDAACSNYGERDGRGRHALGPHRAQPRADPLGAGRRAGRGDSRLAQLLVPRRSLRRSGLAVRRRLACVHRSDLLVRCLLRDDRGPARLRGDDIIRLLAGDCFTPEPLPASVEMKRSLAESPVLDRVPEGRGREIAKRLYERFDFFQGVDAAFLEIDVEIVQIYFVLAEDEIDLYDSLREFEEQLIADFGRDELAISSFTPDLLDAMPPLDSAYRLFDRRKQT